MPFAIIDRARRGSAGVLMILDQRDEANSIAFELRRRGILADVIEYPADDEGV